jgi:hypothetical protein
MHASELALAQRQYLQRINDKLAVIERHVKREALDLIAQLDARVHNPADWLSDYELELEVSFWLRDDDPAYQEDDDNILVTLKEYLTLLRVPDYACGLDDGINHNAFQQRDGHPMQGEYHCWLYHCLYDHTDLWFDDMLRIGHIWVNMPVIYQHACDVTA